MNLNKLKIGDSAKVLQVNGRDKERQHLLDMGFIPGIDLKVVKRAPMGDPLEIRLHGYELAIKNSFAEKIEVEKIKKQDLYNLSCGMDCINCKNKCARAEQSPQTILNKIINKDVYFKNELINETEHPGFGENGRFHNKNNENLLPENKKINFAILGNPNSGKTTLYNALTGSSQHVGNFPGVTVECYNAKMKNVKNSNVIDLPGVYSLSPYSKEEILTRDFVLDGDVDCIINIIDATSIERSLYLTIQLLELECPMVVSLNMMDELSKNDGSVLLNKLEYALGVPIVPVSAIKNEGIEELKEHALHVAKYQEKPLLQDFCTNNDRGGSVHRTIHSIMHIIENNCKAFTDSKNSKAIPVRFAAEKLAENDNLIFERLNLNDKHKKAINLLLTQMEKECSFDRSALIAEMRYQFILDVVNKCVIKGKPSIQHKRSQIADKILSGKWTGIPSFIFIMAIVFWLTFDVVGLRLQKIIQIGIDMIGDSCLNFMTNAGFSDVIISFIMEGVFAGVGTIISFLPIIAVLFFFLSLLEDSGYMARVAFVMDKLLRKIGLSGRSIVPLLIGFGCSVPAIMAARTLPSNRDRKLTIMLIPFMSCSAKLPVYAFITSILFPNNSVFIIFILYLSGIVLGILISFIFKGKKKPVPFIMELPNYRMPNPKNVLHLLWDKCSDFLQRAFSVILIAVIVIWFLQSFNLAFAYTGNPQESILSCIAGSISPLFYPIGLSDWRLVTSLISGFIQKESVIASMAVMFANEVELLNAFTPAIALSFLTFCLLYTPCIASITCVKRELGLNTAIFVIIFQCVVAWLVSFIVFNFVCIFI